MAGGMHDPSPRDAASNPYAARLLALPDNLRGILWMLVATLFYTLTATGVKYLGDQYSLAQILVYRQAVMVLVMVPAIIRLYPQSLHSRRPGLQAAQTLLSAVSMVAAFIAIIHLPLPQVTVMMFGRIFFISVFAVLLLKEIMGRHRWSATLIGFAGVVVAANPTGGTVDIYGLAAIFSVATGGLLMIVYRVLAQSDTPMSILFYQSLVIGVAAVPFALDGWTTPDWPATALLITIGLTSWLAQYFNLRAYRVGEAAVVSPFDFTRLIYAAIFSVIIFSQWPGLNTYLGAALIIGASIYTIHREARQAPPSPEPPSKSGM